MPDPKHIRRFEAVAKDKRLGLRKPEDVPPPPLDRLYLAWSSLAELLIQSILRRPTTIDRAPAVHFDFLADRGLNAHAFADNESPDNEALEFVAVTDGLPLIVTDFFSRLLALPSVLPDVGSIDAEVPAHIFVPNWKPSVWPLLARNGAGEHHLGAVGSSSAERRAFALSAAELAFRFVVYHEMAHLRFGHLYLVRDRSGGNRQLSLDERSDRPIDGLTSQVLEYSADYFAVYYTLEYVLQRVAYPDEGSRDALLFRTAESALRLWSFATYALFWLLGTVQDDDAKGGLMDRPYPPPHMRQLLVMGRALDILSSRADMPSVLASTARVYDVLPGDTSGLRETCFQLSLDVAKGVEHGASTVTGRLPDLDGFRAAGDPQASKHVMRLILHFNEVRPEMLRWGWGRDLMPAVPKADVEEMIALLQKP